MSLAMVVAVAAEPPFPATKIVFPFNLADSKVSPNLSISFSSIHGMSVSSSFGSFGTLDWDELTNIGGYPLLCLTDSTDFTLAENSPCVGTGENGANMGAFGVGCEAILSTDKDVIPLQYVLHQNYPNPFNPVTTLRYELPEDALVNITIYDMMGRQVNTLVNSSQTAGYKSIQWNATNDRNEQVSAGLYLYTIQAGDDKPTKKMGILT